MEIYLDNCATTRVCAEAAEACLRAMTDAYGNPSSLYRFGQNARQAMDDARSTVAECLHCRPDEVFSPPAAARPTTGR